MEKLCICFGTDMEVHGIDEQNWRPKFVLKYHRFRTGLVDWSPKGTYLAKIKNNRFIYISKPLSTLSGAGDDDNDFPFSPMSICYHIRARFFNFSPLDKYLATYCKIPNVVNIKIFDVKTGTLLKEIRGRDRNSWGVGQRTSRSVFSLIRWSPDEQYMSLIEKKGMLYIYASEALDADPLNIIHNVIDFCWSPTDPLIALLQYHDSDDDVLLRIVRLPEGEYVQDQLLKKGVGHFRMHWHPQGRYVACTFKGLEEIESMDTEILILEVGGQNTPYKSASLDQNCSVLAFSFEPQGSRFAVIYGSMQNMQISIMELGSAGFNLQHDPLLGVQANSLYWSPAGEKIVFSGCGDFLLYDVNKIKILVKEEYTPLMVRWSPSGRFVATYGIDNKVAIWRSCGKFMYCIHVSGMSIMNPQILWCPPAFSLNFLLEYAWGSLEVEHKDYKLAMSLIHQFNLDKRIREDMVVEVVEEEEEGELVKRDFYPTLANGNEGGPRIQYRALELPLFSHLLDLSRDYYYRWVRQHGGA